MRLSCSLLHRRLSASSVNRRSGLNMITTALPDLNMITTPPPHDVENRSHVFDDRHDVGSSLRKSSMKRGVQRAATTEFAHLVDDRPDGATAASPPRRGHAVSEAIVSRFVTAFDGIAIFGTGIVTMQWHSS